MSRRPTSRASVAHHDLLDSFIETREVSAAALDQTLRELITRIDGISHQPSLSPGDFAELTGLYNSATYILLYLESNSRHIHADFVDEHRASLAQAAARDSRLCKLVGNLRLENRDDEASRLAFLSHLSFVPDEQDSVDAAELRALRAKGQGILQATEAQLNNFLTRLGVELGTASPDAAFYALLSRTGTASIRAKLAMARTSIDSRRAGELAAVVDAMTAVRRRRSARRGFADPATQTLSLATCAGLRSAMTSAKATMSSVGSTSTCGAVRRVAASTRRSVCAMARTASAYCRSQWRTSPVDLPAFRTSQARSTFRTHIASYMNSVTR